MFNFVLASEQFTLLWKTASILPLHNKGSHYDETNYRPIALLPSLSKVFEPIALLLYLKLVHKHLYSYLESNNFLTHRNSGFRKKHSTLTSLLKTTHDIYLAHDHKLSSRIVFLDISKAFDRIVHTSLLFKLKQLGIELLIWKTDLKWYIAMEAPLKYATQIVVHPKALSLDPFFSLYMSTTFLITFNHLFLYLLMMQLYIFHRSSQNT